MKIVKYIGGLGNQMFTYAFSVALAKRYKEDIYADILYYKGHQFHNGFELTDVFDITLKYNNIWDVLKLTWYIPNYYLDFKLRFILPSGPKTFQEPVGGAYDEKVFSHGTGSQYYWGFWQDHKYFHNFKDEIVASMNFRKQLTGKNLVVGKQIKEQKASIGIHVRRGDYLYNSKYNNICTIEYYQQAIKLITKKMTNQKSLYFYIFSNDITWCKENLTPLLNTNNVMYIDWNKGSDSYIDMQLMSYCAGLIIANSSFSWWGAYLNKREPIVVAPKKWKNNAMHFEFALKEWNQI